MKENSSPQRRRETQRGRKGNSNTLSARPLRFLRLCGELFLSYTQLKLAIAALSLSIAFSACSSQSPSEELKEALRTQRSWAATLRMIAESQTNGALPKAYTRKALGNITRELQKEGERLNKSSKLSADERTKSAEHIEALKQSASEIKQAVEQDDTSRAAAQLEKIRAEEQAIRQSLAESIGEPVP